MSSNISNQTVYSDTSYSKKVDSSDYVYKPLNIKKVLLIYPFAVSKEYDLQSLLKGGQFAEAPIGLGYISAYVKQNMPSVDIKIFDANLMAIKHVNETKKVDMDELWKILQKEIKDYNPDIVGISCLFHSIAFLAHKTCLKVKEVSKKIITVMGGNYPTGSPDTALSDDNLDFIIFSEGEKTFTDFIHALKSGQEPKKVNRSISYKSDAPLRIMELASSKTPLSINKEINEEYKHKMIKKIDDIPYPDRSAFDMKYYAEYTRHFAFRTLNRPDVKLATMTASRGCPFKCTFCSSKDFWGTQIRYRDPKIVVDEMKYLRDEYKINTFVFNDDNIMFNRGSILALCNEMKKQNLDINWLSGGGIQVTAMKPDVIQALVETGLMQFNLAIETGNPKTLKRIKKPSIAGIGERVIENIRKYKGTWIGSNFITGFHFETLDDIKETLKHAGGLDLDWRSVYSFQPLPGTEDYKECVKKGYLDEWSIWEEDNQGELIELSTENFTADQVRNLNYVANIEYNFVNNRNLKVDPNRAIMDFNYVIEMVPDHAIGLYFTGIAYKNLNDVTNALKFLRKAKNLVEESEKLKNHEFKSNLAMVSVKVRWIDYFKRYNLDVDKEIKNLNGTIS